MPTLTVNSIEATVHMSVTVLQACDPSRSIPGLIRELRPEARRMKAWQSDAYSVRRAAKGALTLSAGLASCFATPLCAAKKANLDGERILADFARCAVRAAPRETQMVMDTLPDGEVEKQQLDRLVQNQIKCLDLGSSAAEQQLVAEVSWGRMNLSQAIRQLANERSQMTFSRRALRGALAERLYLGLAEVASSAPPVSAPVDDRDTGVPVGYAVVRCAVAQDPASADRLVRSKRLSSEEAHAGDTLAPVLNNCARGRGRVEISGTAIHGWAAEALYKQRLPIATEGR